jgi:hypothetical protein
MRPGAGLTQIKRGIKLAAHYFHPLQTWYTDKRRKAIRQRPEVWGEKQLTLYKAAKV